MSRRGIFLIAVVLGATACGNDGDVVAATTPAPSCSGWCPAPQPPQTSLTITVDLGDGTTAQEWTLTCDPWSGTHPQPEAACAALAAVDPTVFEPVDARDVCTQIYGGPETATVRGIWNGTPLDASFSRDNGCEIARWGAVVEILSAGTATAGPT